MEIGETSLDIEIGSEEETMTRNNDPIDADFDVICVDDNEATSINDFDGLPPSLLCAFKKDAAEAANKKPEGNSAAVKSFSSVTPAALSSTLKSTAYQVVDDAKNAMPAAGETLPVSHQTVSTADKTNTAANQTSIVADMVIHDTQNTISAAQQTTPTAHQKSSAAKQTVSAADHTADNQTCTAAYKVVSGTQNTIPAAQQRSSAAQQPVLTDQNSPASFPVGPAVCCPIPSAGSAAIVSQRSDASTAAFNVVQSYLQPSKTPAAPQKDCGFSVTGGLRKELIIENSIPLDDEWSALETELILPGKETQSQIATAQEAIVVTTKPVITFQEAFEYFQSADMSNVKDAIQPSIERHGLSALTHYLFGPPKLHPTLLPSKEMTFCMAATNFDNDNSIHVRSLLAIYRNLTGCAQDCRRFGSHWETIGFQGNDPSTDLRGVGVFGLLQLLYLTSKPQLATLKKQIYNLSLHKTQNFPFCVMGLNISKMVLQMLREDRLNRLCNKTDDLMSVTNDAYAACYYKVYHIWKNQNKTIVDSGFILKDVENQLRKSAASLIKELEEYVKNGNTSVPKSKMSKSASDKLDSFVGVADILSK